MNKTHMLLRTTERSPSLMNCNLPYKTAGLSHIVEL